MPVQARTSTVTIQLESGERRVVETVAWRDEEAKTTRFPELTTLVGEPYEILQIDGVSLRRSAGEGRIFYAPPEGRITAH